MLKPPTLQLHDNPHKTPKHLVSTITDDTSGAIQTSVTNSSNLQSSYLKFYKQYESKLNQKVKSCQYSTMNTLIRTHLTHVKIIVIISPCPQQKNDQSTLSLTFSFFLPFFFWTASPAVLKKLCNHQLHDSFLIVTGYEKVVTFTFMTCIGGLNDLHM